MSDPRPVNGCKRCGDYCAECWKAKMSGHMLANLLMLTVFPISVGVLAGVVGVAGSWGPHD